MRQNSSQVTLLLSKLPKSTAQEFPVEYAMAKCTFLAECCQKHFDPVYKLCLKPPWVPLYIRRSETYITILHILSFLTPLGYYKTIYKYCYNLFVLWCGWWCLSCCSVLSHDVTYDHCFSMALVWCYFMHWWTHFWHEGTFTRTHKRDIIACIT